MIPAILLSPLVRKVALYGAIALAVLWTVRWYSNKQWSKGYDEGKVAGIAELEKTKQEEWKVREDALRQTLALANERSAQADAALKQAKALNNDARRVLDNTLSQSAGRIESVHEDACTISADAIDDALRQLSASLGAPVVR